MEPPPWMYDERVLPSPALEHSDSTEDDVLADGGHHLGDHLLDGVALIAREGHGQKGVDIGHTARERLLSQRGGKRLEVFVAGNEIGLAIELDRRHLAGVADDDDRTLTRLLGGPSLPLRRDPSS